MATGEPAEDERCSYCPLLGQEGRLRAGRATVAREFGGQRVELELLTRTCRRCGQVFYEGGLYGVERLLASALAAHGIRCGAALRQLRQMAMLSINELAALLDVTRQTISRWERDQVAIDRASYQLLRQLLDDNLAKRTVTRDALAALAAPPPRSVRAISPGATPTARRPRTR